MGRAAHQCGPPSGCCSSPAGQRRGSKEDEGRGSARCEQASLTGPRTGPKATTTGSCTYAIMMQDRAQREPFDFSPLATEKYFQNNLPMRTKTRAHSEMPGARFLCCAAACLARAHARPCAQPPSPSTWTPKVLTSLQRPRSVLLLLGLLVPCPRHSAGGLHPPPPQFRSKHQRLMPLE